MGVPLRKLIFQPKEVIETYNRRWVWKYDFFFVCKYNDSRIYTNNLLKHYETKTSHAEANQKPKETTKSSISNNKNDLETQCSLEAIESR